MIIMGFPGIGKSTYARSEYGRGNCIDLESSCFNKDNVKWYEDYCRTAIDLANQGYDVFTSTHNSVFNFLVYNANNIKGGLGVIYPAGALKDKWLERLESRYKLTNKEKDLRALTYMKNNYDTAVNDLENALIMAEESSKPIYSYTIQDIYYDLQEAFDVFDMKRGVL